MGLFFWFRYFIIYTIGNNKLFLIKSRYRDIVLISLCFPLMRLVERVDVSINFKSSKTLQMVFIKGILHSKAFRGGKKKDNNMHVHNVTGM